MPTSPVTPGDTGGASILVAEDHPDSRDALSSLLEAVGYDVHVAVDGRDAVARALEVRPDLVLMDMMMPVMDGLEATRSLRSHRDFDRIPILALTAMEGARERALAAGCDDFVTKPIDVTLFFGKIRSWLEQGRA